jgi:hypothetical protein
MAALSLGIINREPKTEPKNPKTEPEDQKPKSPITVWVPGFK